MHFVFDPDPSWHARAKEAVQRAFALNPNGAEAHGAQARIFWSPDEGFQNDAALRSCARSLELRPGSQRTLLYRGMILNHLGLFEEAQESLSAALAVQPDDSTTLVTIAQALWFQNHYEAAADYMA